MNEKYCGFKDQAWEGEAREWRLGNILLQRCRASMTKRSSRARRCWGDRPSMALGLFSPLRVWKLSQPKSTYGTESQAELATFFMYYLLLENMTDKPLLQRLEYWQTFSWKWTKWAYWKYLLLVKTLRFQVKMKMLEKLWVPLWAQILNIFTDISANVNYSDSFSYIV